MSTSEVENLSPYQYIIFKDTRDGLVKAKNGRDGSVIICNPSNAQPLFQAVINSGSKNGTVFIKAGKYEIGSTLDISNKDISIIGEKAIEARGVDNLLLGNVILHRNFSGNLLTNIDTVFSQQHLENLILEGEGSSTGGTSGTGIGIDAWNVGHGEWLRDVVVHNFGTGIRLGKSVYMDSYNVNIQGNKDQGLLLTNTSGADNTTYFFGGTISYNGRNVEGYGVIDVGFHSTTMEQGYSGVIYLASGSREVVFDNCSLEVATDVVSGTSIVTLDDNTFANVIRNCRIQAVNPIIAVDVRAGAKNNRFESNFFQGSTDTLRVASGSIDTVFLDNMADINTPPTIVTEFSGTVTCLGNTNMGSGMADWIPSSLKIGVDKLQFNLFNSGTIRVRNNDNTSGMGLMADTIYFDSIRNVAGTLYGFINGVSWNFNAKDLVGINSITTGLFSTTSGNNTFNTSGGSSIFKTQQFQGPITFASGASGITFSGMQRLPQFEPEQYMVFFSGTAYQALNLNTGVIEQSGTLWSTVMQAVVSGTPNGSLIALARQNFTVDAPVVFPNLNQKKWIVNGAAGSAPRGNGTTLTIGSTFPTSGRYVFEMIEPAGSGSSFASYLEFNGIHFANNNQFTTIAAGAIRYESDEAAAILGPIKITECQFNVMSRGVHLIGWMMTPQMKNIRFFDATNTMSGEFGLRIERDYYGYENASGLSGVPSHGQAPLQGRFENITFEVDGSSQWQSAIVMAGAGNNKFYDVAIAGGRYTDAPFLLKGGTYGTTVYGLRIADTSVIPSPDTRQGSLVFDSSGTFSGGFGPSLNSTHTNTYAPSSGGQDYQTYDNKVYGGSISRSLNSVAFRGSGNRNYAEVEYYGGLIVDDMIAGDYNIIKIREGAARAFSGNNILVTSGGRTTIIDERKGAHAQGIFTTSGDGAAKAFFFPHGLFGNPAQSGFMNVVPASLVARASGIGYDISGNASGITISYQTAPASGTLTVSWQASLYGY